MSSFAKHHQKTFPNPAKDPVPATFTVRKLTGAEVEEAQMQHLAGLVAGRNPRGWAASFQRAMEKGSATAEDALRFIRDPLAGYDRLTVAQRGLTSWTGTEAANGGEPIKATPETVADLDDDALELVATEVMKLTKPHLFMTIEEAEDARKKD